MVDEALKQRDQSKSPTPTRTAYGWGWGRWAWRTLTSMRTAVILLALLALAAIPGSFLPQRNVATDPAAVPLFYRDHPTLAPWLDRLFLFDVYASPWFAAVYLLLLVSMTGCVLPRCAKLWQECRAEPARAPTRLSRMDGHRELSVHSNRDSVLQHAGAVLSRRGYRVVQESGEVRAEKGYIREVGNLMFHLSLLLLLVGMASGKLLGFEGRAALADGETFTNVESSYDEFSRSALTRVDELTPFSVTLDGLDAEFAISGSRAGEPRKFDATVTYLQADGTEKSASIQPNQPLDIEGTKLFLTGHGYAPRVTVRDGTGEVVFAGPVIFLPIENNFTSDGVVKAPNAQPTQLGFKGLFLPTAPTNDGDRSQFPGLIAPRLDLTAYTGDLGMDRGAPQSVYAIKLDGMEEVAQKQMRVGDSLELPDGAGSITFDGVSRFANFQIAYDPGKEISLVAAIFLMIGLTTSLVIRRRRVWVRATDSGPTVTVEIAGQSLTRRDLPPADLVRLERELLSLNESLERTPS